MIFCTAICVVNLKKFARSETLAKEFNKHHHLKLWTNPKNNWTIILSTYERNWIVPWYFFEIFILAFRGRWGKRMIRDEIMIFWAQSFWTSKMVRNHVKLGVFLRVLYCVVDTGYGLGRYLGDCRPALPEGQKYQMVKTQTESHDRRPIVWTNQWQIWGFFSYEVRRGTAGICSAGL